MRALRNDAALSAVKTKSQTALSEDYRNPNVWSGILPDLSSLLYSFFLLPPIIIPYFVLFLSTDLFYCFFFFILSWLLPLFPLTVFL
jgi:hypothetical protein